MKRYLKSSRYPQPLFWLLSWTVAMSPPTAPAQTNGGPQIAVQTVGAQTTLGAGLATSRVIVTNRATRRPLANVKVHFELLAPDAVDGPSGIFLSGVNSFDTNTDSMGEATATNICPIGIPGDFHIHITAEAEDGQKSEANDDQTSLVSEVTRLAMKVTQGQNEANDLKGKKPIVQPQVLVTDEGTGKPVSCAKVTFTFPKAKTEASGRFLNHRDPNNVFWTDELGKATAEGFAPNDKSGKFKVTATASMAPLASGIDIDQQNVSPVSGGIIALIVLGVAGGGAGAALALKKSGTATGGGCLVNCVVQVAPVLSPGNGTITK